MAATSLEKLVQIGSPPIGQPCPEISSIALVLAGPFSKDISQLLQQKNGFYAFESALHVFPAKSENKEIGLELWNSPDLWKKDYGGMADGCLFFAEDVFGGQFCIKSGGIYAFDPETAQLEHMANDIEEWAQVILADYQGLTGFPLAHQWQEIHGRIPVGKRLVPKIPFVAGGEFSIANLHLLDSVEGMRFRAALAVQIKDIPDGQAIKLKLVK